MVHRTKDNNNNNNDKNDSDSDNYNDNDNDNNNNNNNNNNKWFIVLKSQDYSRLQDYSRELKGLNICPIFVHRHSLLDCDDEN